MNIKPGNSYLACGFAPNPEDLKKFVLDIREPFSMVRIAESKQSNPIWSSTRQYCFDCSRGFQKDHGCELIRHKQFYFRHDFTDQEVLSSDF
jgi:hypothetical protein